MTLVNPFPGLRPFHANESHLFFGRENHTQEILRKLTAYRFVSIVGNSGSGKSSLVRAGLLPQIEKDDESHWKICIMRPGKNPIEELCFALFGEALFGAKDVDQRKDEIANNLQILNKSNLGLVQAVRPKLEANQKLLVLVDQFEEIFRFHKMHGVHHKENLSHAFINLLLEGAKQKDVSIYIIMTIRSDFLGDCEQFEGLPEAINDGQFLIPRMNKEELKRSITGPIDAASGKISPRLVQQLVDEVGQTPDQLPILQHVLMRTWDVWQAEHVHGHPMDLQHYEITGGMSKGLSNHAEEAYGELKTDRQRKIAELLFKTITLKGNDNRGIRRPTQVHKIAQIIDAKESEIIEVANIFRSEKRGFIMPPYTVALHSESILDISHESLMRVWERLAVWVDEEAESAELYNRISESALLYEKEMAGLWRDPDLQIALDWRKKHKPNLAWANQYNSNFNLAQRFIDASYNDKKFFFAEKRRRRKYINIGLISFLVMLSIVSIWALTERSNSENNARAAISQTILAEKQSKIAEKQKELAIINLKKAENEQKKAKIQEMEAQKQRRLALLKAEEAKLEKMKAERAATKEVDARKAAVLDRKIAELQKAISDSLRQSAEWAQQKAHSLRMLALAQNLAIKSKLADKNTYAPSVKSLVALQAYKFNKTNGGNPMDPEIFGALFSALRQSQQRSDYQINVHSDMVRSVCFNPISSIIASVGNDGKLCLNNIDNLKNPAACSRVMPLIFDNAVFNENGTNVASSSDNNSIYVFDAANVTEPQKVIANIHNENIMGLVWFGNHIISAGLDLKIRIIDVKKGVETKQYNVASKPYCIALNKNKSRLYIGCENGSIYSLELKEGAVPELFVNLSKGRITCLDLDNKGDVLAYGTLDGTCGMLKTQNPNLNAVSLYGHKSSVTHIRFNPTSTQIASSCYDGEVRLWNLNAPGQPPIIFNEHDSWVMDVGFNAKGNLLASSGKDKTVILYPLVPSEMVAQLKNNLYRNLTKEEWLKYIGNDVPYELTLQE